jgi:hypothetical protein
MGYIQNNYWRDRLACANQYFQEWESRFYCEKLVEYYENFQHAAVDISSLSSRPYTVNLIYSAIQTKISNMLLQHPEFEVVAKPEFSDWDQETAYASAMTKQDVINTIIENPDLYYVDTITQAALDYWFYFSVIEVGFATDWRNPNKLPPKMKSRLLYQDLGDKDKVDEDFEINISESIYFKWIPARRFRVSIADNYVLKNCAWCGYYTYYYRRALENIKDIKFPEEYIEYNSRWSPEYKGPARIIGASENNEKESSDLEYLIRNNEVEKVWMIWDNHAQEKILLHDATGFPMWSEPEDTITLATHRANYRLKGWYPIPPVWYWISPQNEINEAREQMRNYRRRYKRKFAALKGKVDTSELEKLANDIDGEVIIEKEREAIRGIANPEIGVTISADLNQSYADFNHVSGSSQVREGNRETATKSRIISVKEQVRENVERQRFDIFICQTARLGLLQLKNRGTLPMMIKYTIDPSENLLEEVQIHGPAYRQIQTQDLDDGYDFYVKINVKDGSAAQTEEEMQKFVAFLSLTTQFPQIALSPTLIREAAYKVGYRNEKVIREMQQMALLVKMSQMAQMMPQGQNGQNGNAGMNTNNAARNAIENAAPNPMNEINNQLNNQVG